VTDSIGIIPARYASTRFPGKPLAMLGRKPMIQWVYEGANSLFEHLVVATDDQRIYDAVEAFGGKVVMTSPHHASGTERCAEAASLYEGSTGLRFRYVVNIQGDEPLIETRQLEILLDCMRLPYTPVATLIRPLDSLEELHNPHVVKVVVDLNHRALYFSRSPIPAVRDADQEGGSTSPVFYAHIGLYAFSREVLEEVVSLPPTPLEQSESLEQLRWMQHGIAIRTAVTSLPSRGVDTPEDLELLRKEKGF
jgi:3-deoxy-manno-octulosonate cytidylyltransferase (CMP-KDO synthetase)